MPCARYACASALVLAWSLGQAAFGPVAYAQGAEEAQDARPSEEVSVPSEGAGGPVSTDGLVLSASSGVSHWRGEFGLDADSKITAVFLNIAARDGPMRVDVTLPWMDVRSSGMVFAGINGTPLIVAAQGGQPRTRRHGVGDISVGVAWLALKQEAAGLDLDLSARTKLPISATSTQLSTGKSDAYFGFEVSRSFGMVTPAARLGYRIFGDPAGWEIRDGLTGSADLAVQTGPGTFLSLSYEYAERTSAFITDSHALVLGGSARLSDRLRLNAFTSAGMSSGAPRLAAGLSITFAAKRVN